MSFLIVGMPSAGLGLVVESLRTCGVLVGDGCGRREAESPSGTLAVEVARRGVLEACGRLAGDHASHAICCVRHPFEVALSLRNRQGTPLAVGLTLWEAQARAMLAATAADRRIVAHYAAWRHDPAAAAARLVRSLGGEDLSPDAVAACRGAWRPAADAVAFTAADLVNCAADRWIIDAYAEFCREAGLGDDNAAPPAPEPLRRELAAACRQGRPIGGGGRRRRRSRLRAEFKALRREIAARDRSFEELLAALTQGEGTGVATTVRSHLAVHRFRDLVARHVPATGIVAIISKGDEELIRGAGRTAWHYPQDERGDYLGYHPASSLAAIANLEVLRGRGATHLLVPEASVWWLTSYPGLREHLTQHARLVEAVDGVGSLYDLRSRGPVGSGRGLVEQFTTALGRSPAVLAWNSPHAAAAFPGARVFSAAPGLEHLPYIDRSIEVVAVEAASPMVADEARRVASLAVVDLAAGPAVEWIAEPAAGAAESVSIIIPVSNKWEVTQVCLNALLPTLPSDRRVEVIVVDDGSTDETPRRLAALAMEDRRLHVITNEANLGFVGSCNRAAAAASGEYLVFLNNDTVPLPGWLPPLIQTFQSLPTAGVVGAKLLFPDGRLQEAGGIIFDDGSPCHFGREHPDPAWSVFNHVRPVDYVSGAVFATPRKLFAEMGGFDLAFAPGYYEDTDYCFRMRERGREVIFQPASVVVHLEGGTAGTDHAVGMKRYQDINRRRFMERHAAVLPRQQRRPAVIDEATWAVLAHGGRREATR